MEQYLLVVARLEEWKLELFNVKEEIIYIFFLAGSEISVYSFNLVDVSIFGTRRKYKCLGCFSAVVAST